MTYEEAMRAVADGKAEQHDLKCWPAFFHRIETGEKLFEVRRDDRGFQKGDVLNLKEWDPVPNPALRCTDDFQPPLGYTGNACQVLVTYVLRGGQFGIEPGYVVMGIKLLEAGE